MPLLYIQPLSCQEDLLILKIVKDSYFNYTDTELLGIVFHSDIVNSDKFLKVDCWKKEGISVEVCW